MKSFIRSERHDEAREKAAKLCRCPNHKIFCNVLPPADSNIQMGDKNDKAA